MKKEDLKAAISIFCCGIVLGCCIGLVISLAISNVTGRPCNHQGSEYDITFARTSTGTLIVWCNGPDAALDRTYWPESSGYVKACKIFEPYMAYATTLSHNRGRQVTFCEKCWPYEEGILCDTLQ